ncbi:putative muramidase [Cyanobium sp. PCC 7001]|uniref:glycoside hydrolase family 24 protein n=1 Tax=Cyanobium sp. PCC 7001 TaxID=180281 RepID=UPI0001804C46|nr:glycoside hydrolase family 104 protein [Cyanobium sp. PCC 7001]EDY39762.1 putative muramidase [Cyanobium sp. PCC 7001]
MAALPTTLAASAELPGGPARLDAAASRLPAATRVAARKAQGPFTITPQRRALLDTIRYAEGTWKGGRPEGYRVLYGGQLFSRLDRHPEITVRRRYTSAAAGAYQFLPGTWREVSRRMGLRSFEPHNQDQAALYLVQRRRALHLFDRKGLDAEVMARLAPEWASLPAQHGGSYYGQPVKSRQELTRFYQGALARARQQNRAA